MALPAAAIPAIIYGGSQIAGGIINSIGEMSANRSNLKATRETNAANLAIARETNEQSRLNMLTQNQFNHDEAELQRRYDNPVAQRQRLLAAGINSSDMVSYGNSSAASASSLPSMSSPSMTPPLRSNSLSGLGSGLAGSGQSVSTYLSAQAQEKQNQLLDQQIQRSGIENRYLAQEKQISIKSEIAKLENQRTLTSQEKVRLSMLRKDEQYYDTILNQQIRQNDANYNNTIANTAHVEEDTRFISLRYELDKWAKQNEAKHMEREDSIKAMAVANDIRISRYQTHEMAASIKKLTSEMKFIDEQTFAQKLANDLNRQTSVEEKYLYLQQLRMETEKQEDLNSSWSGILTRVIFGVDPQTMLSGVNAASLMKLIK